MPPTPDPSAQGALELLYYIGGGLAALLLGAAGYRRGKSPPPPQMATIAGAIVDNQALAPLFQRFEALIGRLDTLIEVLARDIKLREKEAEEEAQQERVERAVEKALTPLVERLMRDAPATEATGARR